MTIYQVTNPKHGGVEEAAFTDYTRALGYIADHEWDYQLTLADLHVIEFDYYEDHMP